VTNIDATIIAEGALMNGERVPNTTTIAPKTWYSNTDFGVLQNPLVINGRLMTYNTRGGSLIAPTPSTLSFDSILSGDGKCVGTDGKTIEACSSLDKAAQQDLERFRVMMKDPDNNRCTLHVTGVVASNRPDILTRIGI